MSSERGRIIKNSLYLYFRMILIVVVSLYSSRVLLQTLGVVDLGIYNLVGGIIVMLSFLNSSLAGASSRFLIYALGEGNTDKMRAYYSALRFLHIALAVLVLILAQSVGVYFIYNVLDIPESRLHAAFWLLQCSALSALAPILWVPDNSLMIAYERMDVYAYISILEAILKLCIIYLVQWIDFDKLILYGLLYLGVQVVIRGFYSLYSRRLFSEVRGLPRYNREVNREILTYMGWTSIGSLAVIGYTQGLNVLLNIFFGPMVNAARGFAVQMQASVGNIIVAFQTAVRPQIIKSYANDDMSNMHSLILSASRYGFYLSLCLVAPLLLSLEHIYILWLGEIPKYVLGISAILLVVELLSSFKNPLLSAIHATGDIKRFQIVESSLLLLVLPIAYLYMTYWGGRPEHIIFIYFIVELLVQVIRCLIVLPKVQINFRSYIMSMLPAISIGMGVLIGVYFARTYTMSGFWGIIVNSLILEVLILSLILVLGVSVEERRYIIMQVKERLWKKYLVK